MLNELVLGVATTVATASAIAFFSILIVPWTRSRVSDFFIPTTIIAWAIFSLISGITRHVIKFDATGWLLHVVLAISASAALLHWGRRDLEALRLQINPRLVWLIIMLAGVALLPNAYISYQQDWGATGNPVYIESPLQLDPVRNTNIVSALMRGSSTLFIPNGALTYQLLWYYGAASVAGILPEPEATRWYSVIGITLGTAWLFNLVMLWTVFVLCPSPRQRWWVVGLAFVCITFDAGIQLRPVYSGDTPSMHAAFEYFSPAIMSLTAPQHTMFIGLVLLALGVTMARAEPIKWVLAPIMATALVASPILGAIFYPFYFIAKAVMELMIRPSRAIITAFESISIILLAAFLLPIATGVSLEDFFLRGNAIRPVGQYFERPMQHDPIYLAPVAILGWFGFMFYLGLGLLIWQLRIEIRTGSIQLLTRNILILNIAAISCFWLWNYFVTDPELRRHCSIILSSILLFTTAIIFSMGSSLYGFKRGLILASGLAAVYFGVQFINLSTVTSSTVAADLPLADYFCINRRVHDAQTPIRGAIAASGEGIVLPIINEVATALAPRQAILVHQQTTADLRERLIAAGSDAGPYTEKLITSEFVAKLRSIGYDSVIWGPVEESVWGATVDASLLGNSELIMQCGSVGLYAIGDTNSPATPSLSGIEARLSLRKEIKARKQLLDAGLTLTRHANIISASSDKITIATAPNYTDLLIQIAPILGR